MRVGAIAAVPQYATALRLPIVSKAGWWTSCRCVSKAVAKTVRSPSVLESQCRSGRSRYTPSGFLSRHLANYASDGSRSFFTPSDWGGRPLYDSHIPTSTVQKVILATSSAFGGLHDPERADFIATLGDVTGHLALRRMRDKMLADPCGREILREKPVVSSLHLDLDRLRLLPANTFGRAYARFMDERGFSPDERPSVHYVDDAELAYVMRRYRECHDFVHVLSGLGTSVCGEIVQKWYEWLQTGLPMCLLSAAVGPLKLSASERISMATEWLPWAARCAAESRFMLNIPYERLMERDLEELRRELGYAPPPYGIENAHRNEQGKR